ncbi:hypothetical protein GQ43DRAFT_462339 [Delitschia confertaspora ATCC 74209]|uniref:ribonuclease Z n=1 Tax=Delitschia confertaspora ATCC 74209 TaxID=1513339 RepID=A0A9P4MTF4_9PLEO|nr:hypothetical protein GQ43DRAFT_462339 [Delitschia confertaspora ATCC 74209]
MVIRVMDDTINPAMLAGDSQTMDSEMAALFNFTTAINSNYRAGPVKPDPEMESFINYTPIPTSQRPSDATPRLASAALTANDDSQMPTKPAYPYNEHKQQTGLPINSIPGLAQPMDTANLYTSTFPLGGQFGGWDGQAFDGVMGTDFTVSQQQRLVHASVMAGEASNFRAFPGVHQQQQQARELAQQQQANKLAQQLQTNMLAQQQARALALRQPRLEKSQRHHPYQGHPPVTDCRVDDVSTRLFARIHEHSQAHALHVTTTQNRGPVSLRTRRELEDEVDPDRAFLESEEGKKLPGPERRKLRNKISARDFRWKRKDHERAMERECRDLFYTNQALEEETSQYKALLTKIIRHKALAPEILDDIAQEMEMMGAGSDFNQNSNPFQNNISVQNDIFQSNPPLQNNIFMNNLSVPPPRPYSAAQTPTTPFQYNNPLQRQDSQLPHRPVDSTRSSSYSSMSGPPSSTSSGLQPISENTTQSSQQSIHSNQSQNSQNGALGSDNRVAVWREPFVSYLQALYILSLARKRSVAAGRLSTVTTQFRRILLPHPRTITSCGYQRAPLEAPESLQQFFQRTAVNKSKSNAGPRSRPKAPSSPHNQTRTSPQRKSYGSRPAPKKASYPTVSTAIKDSSAGSQTFSRKRLAKLREYRKRHILLDPLPNDHRLKENENSTPQQDHPELGPMQIFIQLLTVPTVDTPGTTILVHTDNKRYIFGNEAEGTQRAINQMGTKLAKVSDLFITGRSEWSNVGGLMGMILTLADMSAAGYDMMLENYNKKKNNPNQNAGFPGEPPQRPRLNLYGAPNLNHILATSRRFIFRKGVPLNATEFKIAPAKDDRGEIQPAWKDENLSVWAISVAPKREPSSPESQASLNSKKRQYDEAFNSFNDHMAPPNETPEDRELRYERIRKSVVNHMFDSDWKFDTLVEKHISEVEMPAAMFIRNPETHSLEPYKGPSPGSDQPLPDIKVLTRTPWPGALVQHLPPTEPALEAVSYILRTHPVRGKFDPKKAVELEIERGPKYAKLGRGESVTNKHGVTITPDMVIGPSRPGQGVAIIEVPAIDYIEPLVNREEWSSESVMQGIHAFIWNLGPGVAGNPALQQFMDKMRPIEHIVSSQDHCPNHLAMDSAAGQTVNLGQVDGDRYRIPVHDNETLPQIRFDSLGQQEARKCSNVRAAQRGLKVRLMPNFEVMDDEVKPPFDVSAAKKEMSEEVLELAEAAHEDIQKSKGSLEAWKAKIPHPDTEIITLGTGSALPSRYRNVSATLVQVPGIGNYLFDAGENTLGQLQRVFTPKEFVEVLRNLRMIWISHLHADHHLGTASVVKAWYTAVHNSVPSTRAPEMSSLSESRRLAVISDEGMLKWLHEYSAIEDFGYSRILPLQITDSFSKSNDDSTLELCPYPHGSSATEFVVHKAEYPTLFGFADIQSCRVAHCRGAKAVSITFPADASSSAPHPLKISYSGDCRPSYKFGQIGKNSTVLIHEATFDDELKGDAVAKKHSTTSEALGVGAAMGARAVVLTHFSQRYQKFPVLEGVEDGADASAANGSATTPADAEMVEEPGAEEDADAEMDGNVDIRTPAPALARQRSDAVEVIKVPVKDMKVAVAFDYMRVQIGDIAQLEKFIPALSRHFAKMEEEGENPELEALRIADGAEDPQNGNVKRRGEKGNGKRGGKRKGGVEKEGRNGSEDVKDERNGNGKRASSDEGGRKKKGTRHN